MARRPARASSRFTIRETRKGLHVTERATGQPTVAVHPSGKPK